MLVAEDGTGRRTFELDGFSLNVLVLPSCCALLKIELERR